MVEPPCNIILVVDDEALVVRTVTSVLASARYKVVVADNGLTGWEAFQTVADQVCLVLADVVMPVSGGIEMAEKILNVRPDLKVLLMTGYTDEVVEPKNLRKLPLIRKPFLPDDLLRRIESVLAD